MCCAQELHTFGQRFRVLFCERKRGPEAMWVAPSSAIELELRGRRGGVITTDNKTEFMFEFELGGWLLACSPVT